MHKSKASTTTSKSHVIKPADITHISKEAKSSSSVTKDRADHIKALEKSLGTDAAGTQAKDAKAPEKKDAEQKAAQNAGTPGATPSTDQVLNNTSTTSGGIKSLTDSAGVAAHHLTDGGGKVPRYLGKASPLAGLVGSATALPGQASKAWDSTKKAWDSKSGEDVRKAVGDTSTAAGTALSGAKSPLELGKAVHDSKTLKAAKSAITKAVPGAGPEVRKAALKAISDHGLKDAPVNEVKNAVSKAARKAAQESGGLAKGVGATSSKAARALLYKGGAEAAEAATKAVGKGLLKSTAKAAGRFVPGVNIGIAAADTAAFAATASDPKASWSKIIASGITAGGSIVAATNVPGLSQAGAAVSTVSSFIGAFL